MTEPTETDLLEAVKDSLQKNGTLGRISGELRAAVMSVLNDNYNNDNPPKVPEETKLINELLREYLTWNGYLYTEQILAADDILWKIQDIIGHSELWPDFIISTLDSPTFQYVERVKICSFFYLDGIRDHMMLYQFLVRIKGMSLMCQYHSTIKNLYDYWNHNEFGFERREKYFSKCVLHGFYETLNSNRRQPNQIN